MKHKGGWGGVGQEFSHIQSWVCSAVKGIPAVRSRMSRSNQRIWV